MSKTYLTIVRVSLQISWKRKSHFKFDQVSKCARVKMEHLQNILFGEADQLSLYGAGLLLSPSSSHLSRKGKLALDQESLSDSEDVALIRKSEKVSFGRRDLFWLGKSSTWKGSVSHNSLDGNRRVVGNVHRLHRLEMKLESFERTFDHLLTNFTPWKKINFWDFWDSLPPCLSARVDQGVFSIKRQSGWKQLCTCSQSMITKD